MKLLSFGWLSEYGKCKEFSVNGSFILNEYCNKFDKSFQTNYFRITFEPLESGYLYGANKWKERLKKVNCLLFLKWSTYLLIHLFHCETNWAILSWKKCLPSPMEPQLYPGVHNFFGSKLRAMNIFQDFKILPSSKVRYQPFLTVVSIVVMTEKIMTQCACPGRLLCFNDTRPSQYSFHWSKCARHIIVFTIQRWYLSMHFTSLRFYCCHKTHYSMLFVFPSIYVGRT